MSVITLCTLDVFDTGERNMQVKEGRFFRKFPTVCSLSVRRMTFMHKRNYKSEGDSHEDFFALVLFSRFFLHCIIHVLHDELDATCHSDF